MIVEIGKSKEGLDILDFSWNWPILDELNFVWGHGEAFRWQHITEVFAGSDVELAFVCMGKKSISVESAEYFLNVECVLRNVVRIDEDVIQIYDDYDVDHIHEDVIHKFLKSSRCISKPFRHYQPLKWTIAGLECSLPFVSRWNLYKVVCMLEIRNEQKWVSVFLGNSVKALEVNTKSMRAVFFLDEETGAPWGEWDGQMNTVARFSSMNLHRATSSSWDKE